MTLRATGRFDCFDRMIGLNILSIVATNRAPYRSRKIPENVWPVAMR